MADELNVVDATTGEHVGKVSSTDVAQLPQHLRVATPEEQGGIALHKKHSGVGSLLTSAAVGVGRGLIPGYDAAIVALGGEGARQELAELSEAHPVATGIGELVGFAGGPVGMAGTATRAATRGRALGAIASGAVEGGLMGVQQASTEAVLENKDLAAESIVASMGEGALLGGGVGAAFAGSGKLVRAGAGRLRSALEGGQGSIGKRMTSLWKDASAATGVVGSEAIEKYSFMTKEGLDNASYILDNPRIVQENTDRLIGAARKLHNAIENTGERFTGNMKRAEIAATIQHETKAAALKSAREVVAGVRGELDDMVKAGRGEFGRQGAVKELRDIATSVGKKLDGDDLVEGYAQVDDLKRMVGDKAAGGAKGTAKATKSRLRGVHERLRTFLEDESLFGQAATIQRELNGPWSGTIGAAKQGKIARHVIEMVPGKWGDVTPQINEARLREVLADPSSPRAVEVLEGIQGWLQTGEALVAAGEKNLKLTKGARQLAQQYKPLLKELRDAAGKLRKAGIVNEDMGRLGSGLMSGVAGAALGFVAGGGDPTAAAAGAALGAVSNPARALRVGHAGIRLASRATKAMERGVSRIGKVAVPLKGVLPWSAMKANETRKRDRELSTLRTMTPAQADERARLRTVELFPQYPDTVDAIGKVAGRAQAYLLDHAPMPKRRPGSVSREIPPTDADWERFYRRRRAIQNPDTILDDARNGLVLPEALHAARAVYPERFEQMRMMIRQELVRLAERGEELPYDVSRSVSMVLGQPVDAIDVPEVALAIQATYAPREEEERPGRSRKAEEAPDLGDRYELNDDLGEVN